MTVPSHPISIPAVNREGRKTEDFQAYLQKIEALLREYETRIYALENP